MDFVFFSKIFPTTQNETLPLFHILSVNEDSRTYLILSKTYPGCVLSIEYYRVDIWGFFKRPELEMVK